MDLGLRLSQKLAQKLVMTPRLQQALKLLQMPSLELSQHIKEELLANPLLEVAEDAEEERKDSSETPEAESAPDSPADDTEASQPEEEVNWADYFDDGFEFTDGARTIREDLEFHERDQVGRSTLGEELTEQLRMNEEDEEILRVAEYIVGCLDDKGFLVVPMEEIAEQLAVDTDLCEQALRTVQRLDPPGVGARDLRESLLIQLEVLGQGDSLAACIVRHHFEAFLRRKYQEIARALRVKVEDLQDAERDIRGLNPRPGAQLALDDARYVTPDLVVEKVEGEYVVSLFDGSVPRLRISRKYQEILRRGTPRETASANGKPKPEGDSRRKEEVDFVQQKLQSASWLIQTIEQRRRTMIRVMEAIVEVQRDFFEKGPGAMRPLTLQNVADRIEMHESTVSRVTTNKYVQTNRGVLPLKHFFSSGLETESGDSVSSKMAQERIRDLIEGENKQKPLSDQRIANLLREDGVIVARRTVAKYREKMGLLTARLRKEY